MASSTPRAGPTPATIAPLTQVPTISASAAATVP